MTNMEDYKKKYEQALSRASYIKDYNTAATPQEVAELLFPELKESEEIRKELIKLMKQMSNTIVENYTTIEISTFVAWLEKQGKKNNMGISEATKKVLEDNLNKALEKETPKSWNEFLDKQGEQKPTWSEEDDDNIMLIEDRLSDYIDYIREDSTLTKHQKNSLKEEVIGHVNWLKSLKERMKGGKQ